MLKDIVTFAKSDFPTGADTVLRTQENRSRRVVMQSGSLAGNARSDTSGVCARVCRGGMFGFASDSRVSEAAAREVLMAAEANSKFLTERSMASPRMRADASVGADFRTVDDSDTSQSIYLDYVRELDAYIQKKYPSLAARTVVATADSMEKLICTSDACDAHTMIKRSYIYLVMVAEADDGAPVSLFDVLGGFGGFDKNFPDPSQLCEDAERLYEKVMKKRCGIQPQSGVKTCILGGALAGMLAHEAVGHTVEADLVQAGSVASHCLGKRVASELVSMTDFANTTFGIDAPLPVYVDDEGIIACDAPLIKEGILVGYMNDRESAAYYGMKPCGNARAFSYADEPLIRMRNTAVLPGKSKLDEMIASVDDGYYFTDTNNGQADTTGEFMFGVTMGYEIKNGKLGRALRDTTISGVAFDMLKTVDMVSDDMVWCSSGMCGKKQTMPVGMGGPAVRCRITVG